VDAVISQHLGREVTNEERVLLAKADNVPLVKSDPELIYPH
jgi:hypothetical protein